VRQLLVRIDDELHRRLKARAAAEGQSANRLVNELLEEALAEPGGPAALRARLERAGRLVRPRTVAGAMSRDATIEGTRGAGRAASEALEAERGNR
jgi:plasmid stability protein